MSLNKAIKYGKEHRKPYTGSKAIDRTCRNHGGCPCCESNRKHKFRDTYTLKEVCEIAGITAEDLINADTPEIEC